MSEKISLADRLSSIKPSPTLAVNARAKALRAEGADVLNFSVGEPDFGTPEAACEAGKKAIDDGFTRYTPVPGIPELRERIVELYEKEHGWTYSPEQVQVSCGGKHGLYNMAQAMFNPGDEVLILAPYWVSYPAIVILAGAEPVFAPLSEDRNFDLDPEVLKKHASQKTRGIIVNSPSNPTGAVLSQEALEAVAEMAREHGWVVISDDIYDTICFSGERPPHILDVAPDLKDQVLILNGVSKSYAMTGWRIGYSLGPAHVIAAMNKIQSQSTSNPSSVAQMAALAAIESGRGFADMMTDAFRERPDYLLGEFASMEGVECVRPSGAFYVFPNLSAYYGRKAGDRVIDGSVAMSEYLLEEALLATVPGAAFGSDAHVRFSFATSMDVLREGMARLRKALAALG